MANSTPTDLHLLPTPWSEAVSAPDWDDYDYEAELAEADYAKEMADKEAAERYHDAQREGYYEYLTKEEAAAQERLQKAQEAFNEIRNEFTAAFQPEKWRDLFHTRKQIEEAPPITFAIQDFLQDDTTTMIGGLPGHGKTLVALAMGKSLLEGTKLFDRFEVNRKTDRLLYIVPEASLTTFADRIKTFGLTKHIGDRLFVRTLSADGELNLSDPRLLEAVKGADVILDTAIRFLPDGIDENNAADMRKFSKLLFALLKAGARTVTGLHHSPKFLGNGEVRDLTLENVLRGSGDLGAMCGTCWGSYQVDPETTTLYLEAVKCRDFQAPKPLLIQGRPSLDKEGSFTLRPEQVESLLKAKQLVSPAQKPGPKPTAEATVAEAKRLADEGLNQTEIGKRVGKTQQWVSKTLRQLA